MSSASFGAPMDERVPGGGELLRSILWLLWQCIRVPALLLLVVLEPVVSFVLSSLALLGVLTAFFLEIRRAATLPIFLVLGVSLGFEFALVLYHALLRLLGKNW